MEAFFIESYLCLENYMQKKITKLLLERFLVTTINRLDNLVALLKEVWEERL